MSFECHITTTVGSEETATVIANARKWKTSEIKRDPLLGDGSHFYLTKHEKDFVKLFREMKATSFLLQEAGLPVLREKIELIVYDTKTGTGV